MAKYIVDEEVLLSICKRWYAPYGVVKDVIKQCDELIYCEDCDMSKPTVAPFLHNSFVHCVVIIMLNLPRSASLIIS